jgi:exodeoxyribonuclease VII small subunit
LAGFVFMAQKKKNTDVSKLEFEDAIESLSGIVNRIERGETGLGASLEQYERGMALINHCRDILQAAEKRIEKIASSDETPEKKDSNTANVDKDDKDDSDNKDDSLF